MLDFFRKDPFFLVFFFLPCTAITLLFLLRCYTLGNVVYYMVALLSLTYVLWIACNGIGKGVGSVLKTVLVFLASIYFLINAFLWIKFENILSPEIVNIFAATNSREASEFCSMYVSPFWVMAFLLLPLWWTWLYRKASSLCPVAHKWFLYLQALLGVVVISSIVYSPTLFAQSIVGELWNYPMDNHVDLYQHQTFPEIEEIRQDHPEKVIVIVGESFARSHSSLYGYSRETNPGLRALTEQGDLFAFTDVTSPSTSTLESFREILGSYDKRQNDKKWYDCTNLIEVFRFLGFHVSWVSNQGYLPMLDDVSSTYSRYCDESHFNKEDGSGLDEFVLDYDYADTGKKEAVIYHLMGQHGVYAKRYPESFAHFEASDYIDLPENQRSIIAEYDNATLYNDYIVSSLMNRYSGSDAVVFYFPDHGQDLFETDPDKFGHGRLGNAESVIVGTQIPFFIYTNSLFRETHPEALALINKRKDIQLNTTDFYSLALDVMGYTIR